MDLDINEMKAKNLPRASFATIFKITEGELAAEEIAAIDMQAPGCQWLDLAPLEPAA